MATTKGQRAFFFALAFALAFTLALGFAFAMDVMIRGHGAAAEALRRYRLRRYWGRSTSDR